MPKSDRNRPGRKQQPRTPRRFEGRGATGEASEEDTRDGRSGSRTDSSQQRRAGGRGWSSWEFEANRRYLDKEVERRVREKLLREKERWERGRRQEEEGRHTRKEGVSWSEGGGSEGSQQRPRSMSGSKWKDSRWDSTVPQEFENPGQADKGEEGRDPSPQQCGGTDEGGTSVGLPGVDVRAGRETWQIGPTLGVQGQPVVGYNRGSGRYWRNPGSLGTQGSWVGNPGAYGGLGGTRATEAAANQQRWAGPEAAPLWLQGNFHPGSGWSHLGSVRALGAALPGASSGWGEGGGLALSTGRESEPWPRM